LVKLAVVSLETVSAAAGVGVWDLWICAARRTVHAIHTRAGVALVDVRLAVLSSVAVVAFAAIPEK
jgi:hypothetical protein